ncbi:fumarylacetoacetate hydrolase family protein [Balneolaceae bacterium YR4-1]|uniref:Fumarylacetoacetate hydrolase family protein n=1 Tax=Halalkalibaculum roseum TaxID=2709311 RepID=A0A6M1T1G3_9BACT|nr:fumarylacetoacetate hydrolase family protein [Halalkalibaculum roseum]NGP75895.1 fumarylacetoacetate hydrolase family protein [Halalkalibaculum roseum]
MSKKPIPGLDPELSVNSIFCIGRNYAKHAKELKNVVPDQPMVFLKPVSALIFEGDSIVIPEQSKEVHHEVELVVAIGKTGKNIPESKAINYIRGYGIGIDVTARDIQQKAKEKSHPWSVAKGFDTFAPLSHFVKTSAIDDPQQLDLQIEVNGEIRQQGNTRDMIFPVKTLISYLSTIFTLSPGDLIFTGTPEGVSPIKSGDKIKATLGDHLAELNVSVSE